MKRTNCFFQPYAVFLMVLLTAACTPKRLLSVMDSADSLMDARPDSALTLLNTLLPDTNTMSKRDLMRFHLLRTNAQNKCDTVFTARHATLMHRVCDYYDHKSSPMGGREGVANSRMLAHYLLGRCYDDMGEAPAALREFTIAEDQADTTSTACDYLTLCRVYFQLSDLFYMQDLFAAQREVLQKARVYAFISKDTLSAIWSKVGEASCLSMSERNDSALILLKDAYHEYKDAGREDLAAQTLGIIISNKIDNKRYDVLEPLIKEYEENSGYFDTEGNALPGYELWYYKKGLYYLHGQKRDSAEHFFRKCLANATSTENRMAANKGLFLLYCKENRKDSIEKYAINYTELNDELQEQNESAKLMQLQAHYRYERLQETASRKTLQLTEKNATVKMLTGLLVALLTIIITLIYFINEWKKKKLMEWKNTISSYEKTIREHERESNELQLMLEQKNSSLQTEVAEANSILCNAIMEKSQRINTYENEIRLLKNRLEEMQKKEEKYSKIRKQATMEWELLKDALKRKAHDNPPVKIDFQEWKRLHSVILDYIPDFYYCLRIKNNLTDTKYDLCVMYRMGFRPMEIANLMGIDKSTVTTMRHRIYKEIFGKTDEADEFIAFIMSIS